MPTPTSENVPKPRRIGQRRRSHLTVLSRSGISRRWPHAPTPPADGFSLCWLAVLTLLCWACASTTGPGLADADTLRAEAEEWRGDRSGRVVLRRHIHGVVDTAVKESDATSRLTFHLAIARVGGAPQDEALTLLIPRDATLASLTARHVLADRAVEVKPTDSQRLAFDERDKATIDPGQAAWRLRFSAPPPKAILEVLATFDVPGTLRADAHFLSVGDAPTHELLLRYDVPTSAAASFQLVSDRGPRPLVTEKDGHKVIALLRHNLRPRQQPAQAAYARYVTARTAPKNYVTQLAATWQQATATARKALVDPTVQFREGAVAPFTPASHGIDAARAIFDWVQRRIQRADAQHASLDAGRNLLEPLRANDLTQTDKVHLLHWLLSDRGIDSKLGIARRRARPPLAPNFPTPDAFSVPLVYIAAHDVWLDAACRRCAFGQVREALRGGQAIALPATAKPVQLP